MWTLVYIVLTAIITWKVAKLFFTMKFKYDIKFIESIVRNVGFVVQKEKIRQVQGSDEE